jgi:hypothetical protein
MGHVPTGIWLGCTLLAAACAGNSQAAADEQSSICRPATARIALSGLPEASGIALGRRTPQLLWSHNDSGEPLLLALDAAGAVKGKVRVTGATVEDWEDVAVGPCPGGSCLFIADIGDNNRARRSITVYSLPEPGAQDASTAHADALVATYPDGRHDAEALFVTATGELFIITKEDPAAVYRFPTARGAGSAQLEKVALLPLRDVTDADTSPDGRWVAVRTHNEVVFYRTRDLVSAQVADGISVDLRALKEPQGEGVTMDSNGMVYLVGEGGTGTFATLRCSLPR